MNKSLKLEIQVVGGFGGECLRAGESGVCIFTIKGAKQIILPTLRCYGKGGSERSVACPPYVRSDDGGYDKYQAARITYEFIDGSKQIVSSGVVCLARDIEARAEPKEVHTIPITAPRTPGRYKLSVAFDNTNVSDAEFSTNTGFGALEIPHINYARIESPQVDVTIE